jgi:ABC-type multidrug transport system permease subunit
MTDASVPLDGEDRTTESTETTETADATGRPRTVTPLWLAVTIAVLFGVLYAYDVWEAVRDLVGMSLLVSDLGVSFAGTGLALLIAALVVPLVVFGLAFWLGYRRGPLAQVLLFLVGWALVQALTLDIATLFELGGIDFSTDDAP